MNENATQIQTLKGKCTQPALVERKGKEGMISRHSQTLHYIFMYYFIIILFFIVYIYYRLLYFCLLGNLLVREVIPVSGSPP